MHSGCNKDDYIDEDVNIICDGPYSYCRPRFFFDTTFNCGKHTTAERAEGNPQSLSTKLTILGVNKYGGSKTFLLSIMGKLIDYINDHPDDFK